MTEQKYMQEFIRRNAVYWLIALILGVGVGVLAAARLTPSYEGAVTFHLTNKNADQSNATFYTYDGYYSEQTAQLERANLASWITTPRTVFDIYTAAGLGSQVQTTEDTSGYLKVATANGPTSILTTTYKTKSETDAKSIGSSLATYAKDKYASSKVSITASDPIVVIVPPKKNLTIAAIALIMTCAVFFVTLVTHYFRPEA